MMSHGYIQHQAPFYIRFWCYFYVLHFGEYDTKPVMQFLAHFLIPFYGDLVYKFKRIVGNPNLVINSKILSSLIKRLDITWMSCDSLHAWF